MSTLTNQTEKMSRVRELVIELNHHRHLYYNENAPIISDAEFDKLFDELTTLEKETGLILSNSPTQNVGAPVISSLPVVQHDTPLLSLDKTKEPEDVVKFVGEFDALLMLKLDGLTVNIKYNNGELIQASTRGDGHEGEEITHNARVFLGVPLKIPHKGYLSLTGEAYILNKDFEHLKATIVGSDGKPYKNSRNLAAGSARQHDAGECAKRRVRLSIFGILDGTSLKAVEYINNSNPVIVDINSKSSMLNYLFNIGFDVVHFHKLNNNVIDLIPRLEAYAKEHGIPIDGLVTTYDDVTYSKSLGRTGHHYRDGLAFKFEDDTVETMLRSVTWKVTRTGLLSCTANFDTVEIDGTDVSNASLHNIKFIEGLNLKIGDRITVSKRNMIIPHVETNLDSDKPLTSSEQTVVINICPCCGYSLATINNEDGEPSLYCENKTCADRILRQFEHFVSKKAMDISGLSTATLKKFIEVGLLNSKIDVFSLGEHEDTIVKIDKFGKKAFERLVNAIKESQTTTMEKFIISMDIPMLGRHASAILCKAFDYDINKIRDAAIENYDFTTLEDFGEILQQNICNWFKLESNINQWNQISKLLTFKTAKIQQTITDNPFTGKIIVATGSFETFTRDSVNEQITALGAKAGSSVSKKTDYVIIGEKAGSKKEKAESLGITILTEAKFREMAGL